MMTYVGVFLLSFSAAAGSNFLVCECVSILLSLIIVGMYNSINADALPIIPPRCCVIRTKS